MICSAGKMQLYSHYCCMHAGTEAVDCQLSQSTCCNRTPTITAIAVPVNLLQPHTTHHRNCSATACTTTCRLFATSDSSMPPAGRCRTKWRSNCRPSVRSTGCQKM